MTAITLLICTKDRPDFLVRPMQYYLQHAGIQSIVISDASSEANWHLNHLACPEPHGDRVVHLRASPSQPLSSRIRESLNAVHTDLVFLVADDDVVFLDWLDEGVRCFHDDPETVVVFGHTMHFAIGTFEPRGVVEDAAILTPRPPLRWLASGQLDERLKELGKSDWETTGWYALQRVQDLKLVCELAMDNQLDGYAYERFLIFAQASLGKTVMLDEIFLARQIHRNPGRQPYGLAAERQAVRRMEQACMTLLTQRMGMEPDKAAELFSATFARELEELKTIDRRRWLRAVRNRFPSLYKHYSHLRGRMGFGIPTTSYGDPRLPAIPQADSISSRTDLLASVFSGSPGSRSSAAAEARHAADSLS